MKWPGNKTKYLALVGKGRERKQNKHAHTVQQRTVRSIQVRGVYVRI